MTLTSPIFRPAILLVDTTHESNRQLQASLGGVFELIYVTSQFQDLDGVIEKTSPKLIILEIFDAAKLGLGRCREIAFRDSLRDLPVVVIISAHEVALMSTGYYMGASDYMTKPLIPAEVLARVGGQLELANTSNAIKDIEKNFKNELSYSPNQALGDELKESSILVVDDCIESLNPMIEILSSLYNVMSATNGYDAVQLVNKHKFDLIVMDVVMPKMNGYDACRQIKKNRATAEIPIIFLTGQSESRHEALGFSIGAVDYILKPASLSILLARVRAHLLNSRRQNKLSLLTYQDPLTQIPNRRRFNEMYSLEYKRALRYKKSLSLLVVDIDEFKKYNDFYGHVKGDDCLKEIGLALSSCQRRPGDLVSRMGGEEFVVLLPDNDEKGALNVAKRILETIENLAIAHAPEAKYAFVSVSIGLATMNPEAVCTQNELIEIADKMLYTAKAQGRNCVCSNELACAC